MNRSLNGLRRLADDAVGRGDGAAPFAQRPDGLGDVALDVAHVTPRPGLTVPVPSLAARSITASTVEPTTGSLGAGPITQFIVVRPSPIRMVTGPTATVPGHGPEGPVRFPSCLRIIAFAPGSP